MKKETKEVLKKVGKGAAIVLLSLTGSFIGTFLCLEKGVKFEFTWADNVMKTQ